jgi:hypothetical protein
VPRHRGTDGVNAHREDSGVGEQVDHGQGDHRQPARWGKPQGTEPVGAGPDGLAGIPGGPVQQPAGVPQRPRRAGFQRAAQPWLTGGHAHHQHRRDGEHTARRTGLGEQGVAGGQPAAGQDQPDRGR